jgi:hypothetical protein
MDAVFIIPRGAIHGLPLTEAHILSRFWMVE